MSNHSRELFTVTLVVHAASKGALRCSETGDADEAKLFWIPRSEMTLSQAMELKLARYDDLRPFERGTLVLEMTIPEWLAYDRGLL